MIIDFSCTEENIQICFNKNQNKLTFSKHKIIFLLWNSLQSHYLILDSQDKIQVFKKEYEEYKNIFENQIIFCYYLQDFESKLDEISLFLPANFFKFCNLNIFWYQIIIKDKIYEENFLFDLSQTYQVEIDIYNLNENSFLDINLSDEIEMFNSFNINYASWEKEIKELTLDNILLEKTKLYQKYKDFHNYLDVNLKKNKFLDDLINKYISIVEDKLSIKKCKVKNNVLNNKKKFQVEIQKELEICKNQEILSIKKEIIKKQETLSNKNKNIKLEVKSNNQNFKEKNKQNEIYKLKNQFKPNVFKFQKNIENPKSKLQFKPNPKTKLKLKAEITPHLKIVKTKEDFISKKSVNLAVMINIYQFSLWPEFTEYLDRISLCDIYFDLYINIAIDSQTNKDKLSGIVNRIQSYTKAENLYLSYSDNKGLDIGGFMISYLKMLEVNKKYFSIIKIHTKTNKNWRFVMLYSLLGNIKIIKNNLKLINLPHVGMIGYQTAGLNYNTNKTVRKYIFEYVDKFKQKNINGHFIPGTIFWIKGEVLQKYFTFELLKTCYQEFKPYYCGSINNRTEGKPHAFERFFGILVENCGLKTIKFDSQD